MGKRGPRSQHPSGNGYITAKGYHRVYDPEQGRYRLAHDVIWEAANGPIPEGFEIHHRDGDKQNNDLANLELITDLDHKREHSPHYRRADDGSWERCCSVCRVWKPATSEHFYLTKRGWIAAGRCRPCHIRKVVESKQRRRGTLVS